MFIEKSIFNIKNNTLIVIEGDDKYKFIQGIISNDIEILKKKKSIYASILSPQGRFVHDFFITKWNDNFILECSRLDSDEILKKFNLYKLKSDVKFRIEKNFKIFLINFSSLETIDSSVRSKLLNFSDPRFNNELTRVYIDEKYSLKLINSIGIIFI